MRKRIDLNQILMGGSRSPGAIKAYRIGQACLANWKATARKELTDVSPLTRRDYISNIKMESSPRGVRIALRGMKVNIIEQGMGPGGIGTQGTYDARKFILKAPYSRVKGKRVTGYKVIPFRRSMGAYGGKANSAANALAQAMQKAQQSGKPYKGPTRLRAGLTGFGSRRGLGVADRPIIVNGKMFHPHAVDPLAGAKVEVGSYSGKNMGAEVTAFRAMSKKGKPWMTRGVRARRIVNKLNWRKILENARRRTGGRP